MREVELQKAREINYMIDKQEAIDERINLLETDLAERAEEVIKIKIDL